VFLQKLWGAAASVSCEGDELLRKEQVKRAMAVGGSREVICSGPIEGLGPLPLLLDIVSNKLISVLPKDFKISQVATTKHTI